MFLKPQDVRSHEGDPPWSGIPGWEPSKADTSRQLVKQQSPMSRSCSSDQPWIYRAEVCAQTAWHGTCPPLASPSRDSWTSPLAPQRCAQRSVHSLALLPSQEEPLNALLAQLLLHRALTCLGIKECKALPIELRSLQPPSFHVFLTAEEKPSTCGQVLAEALVSTSSAAENGWNSREAELSFS